MTEAILSSDASGSNTLAVSLSGDWLLGTNLPGVDTTLADLRQLPRPTTVRFDTSSLGEWDTGLITTLITIHQNATNQGIEFDDTGLPDDPGAIARAMSDALAQFSRDIARELESVDF